MRWINQCLSSLEQNQVLVQIIVIDNASSDQTVQYIKSNFPKVILFENTQNLGFGAANNQGIELALKRKADYIFLLNQDAWVKEDTLDKLIKSHQQNPQFGLISPIQLSASGNDLEESFALFLKIDTFKKDRSVIEQKLGKADLLVSTNFVNAAAWLLPVDTILRIGGFNPLFFYTGEDLDYINRMKFHQIQLGIHINAYISHDTENRTPLDFQHQKDLYRHSVIADCYKRLTNINQSFILCTTKYLYYFMVTLGKGLSKKTPLSFYLSIFVEVNQNLSTVLSSRKQYKKQIAYHLNMESMNEDI